MSFEKDGVHTMDVIDALNNKRRKFDLRRQGNMVCKLIKDGVGTTDVIDFKKYLMEYETTR